MDGPGYLSFPPNIISWGTTDEQTLQQNPNPLKPFKAVSFILPNFKILYVDFNPQNSPANKMVGNSGNWKLAHLKAAKVEKHCFNKGIVYNSLLLLWELTNGCSQRFQNTSDFFFPKKEKRKKCDRGFRASFPYCQFPNLRGCECNSQ